MNEVQVRNVMACPLNGKLCKSGRREDFPKDEVGAPTQCRFWVHIIGKTPQTDESVNHQDCSIAWLPTLQIEGAQMTRQASAEINEVRKEVRKSAYFTKKLATIAFRAGRALMEMAQSRSGQIEAKPATPELMNGKNGDNHAN